MYATGPVSKIEVCISNVATRRITGLGRSVRIESSHFLAATSSYRNLYLVASADLVDAILRVEGGSP